MASAVASVEPPAQVLVFSLADEEYCVGVDWIDEIVKAEAVRPIPDTPRMVDGVMDRRGETTTIVDLTVPFGVTRSADEQQVIVFETDNDRSVGWLVDYADRVRDFENPDLESVEDNRYINGIVQANDKFIFWVDPTQVNDQLASTG
ncbi:chemotaxis protein CheW [Halorhabdus sp. CUG00001]|uniref:chemotaxis protein CheW n=1 Tax=Halorhabdus sp. CUG00001 TaxID=2600297 RepID=UPI00131AFA3C|nr:chemotaxis protein CheW [Halorhabdus sp. CUG00001]